MGFRDAVASAERDHVQTICTSLQADNRTNTPSLNFYRPGALRDAQSTVSKHWRQLSTNTHKIVFKLNTKYLSFGI